MLNALSRLVDTGYIRALDYQFARFLTSLYHHDLLALVSALTSHQLGQGNVCLRLDRLDTNDLFGCKEAESHHLIEKSGVAPDAWPETLKTIPLITDGDSASPLVLQDNRLYLRHYWLYEKTVSDWLSSRPTIPVNLSGIHETLSRLFARNYTLIRKQLTSLAVDDIRPQLIKWFDIETPEQIDWQSVAAAIQADQWHTLDQLIPESTCLNWQKVAAAVAATRPFTVISGGPGTGKTTTVTRLLALLVEQGIARGKVPDIQLVAPTGKAAARLTESIGHARSQLNCCKKVRESIPAMASTLHRLLGVIPNQPDFRHNRQNRLHLDILVVDEASMVDLPMMARLLAALPDHARLILLGDRDQLSSVEAGSVLGDLCSFASDGYSPGQCRQLEQLTGFDLASFQSNNGSSLRDSLCLLRKSYRFDAHSGIGQLACAVNSGNPSQVNALIDRNYPDITLHTRGEKDYPCLMTLALEGYRGYLNEIVQQGSPETIIAAFNRFRVLCAVREGRYGVAGLNLAISQVLACAGLIRINTPWYVGRPVLIARNDHGLGLRNGDIGITLPDTSGRLRVAFEMPDRSIQTFLPSRLPEHETVFAMTIHKSQGSEFDHTVIVLPDQALPVLTRELVYTGITRARTQLDLFACQPILEQAVGRATIRDSGLAARLATL